MIINEAINEEFKTICNLTNEAYASSVIMNSLKILGVKKSKAKNVLEESDYALINNFKYPERLIQMMETASEHFKVEGFFSVSFTKIALMSTDNIKF